LAVDTRAGNPRHIPSLYFIVNELFCLLVISSQLGFIHALGRVPRRELRSQGGMPSMKKNDLIQAVAKKAKIPQNVARQAVEAILAAIVKGVKRGPVLIDGFGKFRVQRRRARVGRNPRTGEPIQIAPTAFPVFIAGERLRQRMSKPRKRSKD